MSKFRDIARQVKRRLTRQPESFLSRAKGIIHIGANTGQERVLYRHWNLNVIWIEPIPEVFQELEDNISDFNKQSAYQYLIVDKDNENYEFKIANNSGQSSSIFELKQHKDIWPDITFEKTINLSGITLPTFLENENIDIKDFDVLIIDTQGSELLVLKGAEPILSTIKFIQTEATDFEAYSNCCQLDDIDQYLYEHDFKQLSKKSFAQRNEGGSYYDVLYRNMKI